METKSTVPKQGAISARQRSPPAEVAAVALKLGFTAFGGPAVHIAMLRQEVVVRRRWMTDEEFMDALGATNLIPGPNSTEMMIHVGLQRAGWAKIGLPSPEFLAPFVGFFGIGCGVLVLLGLATRLAAIPLIIDMLVAIATTKFPILREKGLWAAAHEARTDWAMLLGSLFLQFAGAGPWSVDAWMSAKLSREKFPRRRS
jgi:chromate transport protein ChrA